MSEGFKGNEELKKSSADYVGTPKARAGWAGLVGLVAQMANASLTEKHWEPQQEQ